MMKWLEDLLHNITPEAVAEPPPLDYSALEDALDKELSRWELKSRVRDIVVEAVSGAREGQVMQSDDLMRVTVVLNSIAVAVKVTMSACGTRAYCEFIDTLEDEE